KFVMAGGIGAVVQFVALIILRAFVPYILASFLAIECAVISNFIINNVWTFSDRRLKAAQIPAKFVAFNFASFGSIIIQLVIAFLGEKFIGTEILLFVVPIVHLKIDTGMIFAVVGIL